MNSLRSQLKKIRAELEARRKKLPISPKMCVRCGLLPQLIYSLYCKDCQLEENVWLEQEQLSSERQAKSWEENRKGEG